MQIKILQICNLLFKYPAVDKLCSEIRFIYL